MKKTYLKIAGVLNLLTAFLHLFGGQIDLVNPLLDSALEVQKKSEWLGAWHMVTILLFFTSYLIIKGGFSKSNNSDPRLLRTVGIFYILTGIPFIATSIYFSVFAPQWVLLMPIGILLLFGSNEK